MLEIVSYEHMLARVNDEGENFKRSWDRFFSRNDLAVLWWLPNDFGSKYVYLPWACGYLVVSL